MSFLSLAAGCRFGSKHRDERNLFKHSKDTPVSDAPGLAHMAPLDFFGDNAPAPGAETAKAEAGSRKKRRKRAKEGESDGAEGNAEAAEATDSTAPTTGSGGSATMSMDALLRRTAELRTRVSVQRLRRQRQLLQFRLLVPPSLPLLPPPPLLVLVLALSS